MLTYDLTKRGSKPLYQYLYECLRSDILHGTLPKGTKLPSKRALAQHLSVGVITVANAYEQLNVEGYITSKEKRGYFVNDVSGYRVPKSVRKTPPSSPLVNLPPLIGEVNSNSSLPPQSSPLANSEPEFLADFKANRISVQNFPLSTWMRLMRETLSTENERLLATVPYNGVYELRLAIAVYLEQNLGMYVSPDQIVIGAGTEYLYSRLLQLFGRDAVFAIEEPGYKRFATISESFGNDWRYIPIDDSGLMVDELEASGADVVHVSPVNHFPTGIVMPVARRVELFEWVNRKKPASGRPQPVYPRYIIEDAYDSEFRYTGHFIPPLYAQDTQHRVIYLNTFSKSLVPSLRISYMVLPPRLMRRYEESQSFYSCTVSSFEQYTLARFINEGYFERHINKMKNYYREQRKAILQALHRSPLAKISTVQERNAGTHFLLQVHTPLSQAQVQAAAEHAHLQLSFYSDYSNKSATPAPDGAGVTLIINYAAIQKENIARVVETLAGIFLS